MQMPQYGLLLCDIASIIKCLVGNATPEQMFIFPLVSEALLLLCIGSSGFLPVYGCYTAEQICFPQLNMCRSKCLYVE